MASMNRREQHNYRISFAREVGSSFDPDMEDVAQWEEEFTAPQPPTPVHSRTYASNPNTNPYQTPIRHSTAHLALPSSSPFSTVDEEEWVPELEEEEIEAYAEEYARMAEEQLDREESARALNVHDELAGLEDIPADELFGWDFSEGEDGDVDMDMS